MSKTGGGRKQGGLGDHTLGSPSARGKMAAPGKVSKRFRWDSETRLWRARWLGAVREEQASQEAGRLCGRLSPCSPQ